MKDLEAPQLPSTHVASVPSAPAPAPSALPGPLTATGAAELPIAGSARARGGSSGTRGRSAIHVDLGDALKADLAAAAGRAGQSPSDWVRATLRRAVDAQSPAVEPLAPVQPGRSGFPEDAPRPVAVHLAADDIAFIDAAMEAGGFRSRPAALRFLLRAAAVDQGAAVLALTALPELLPRLADANIELRAAARRLLAAEPASAGALWKQIDAHLLLTAQALAALRPLLASPDAHVANRGRSFG